MGPLLSAFDQTPRQLPIRFVAAVGGLGYLERVSQLRGGLGALQSDYQMVARPGITESIEANIASSSNRYAFVMKDAIARAQFRGTFSEITPVLTHELNHIRTLLAEGRLREARSFIAGSLKRFPTNESLFELSRITARQDAIRVAAKFQSRQQEVRWLREHGVAYKGKWVALVGNELVVSVDTIDQLRTALAAIKLPSAPLIHKVR